VVALVGELDVTTVPDVHDVVRSAVEDNPGATVVVNLAAVTFLDSTCLNMFARVHQRAVEAGGRLRVAQPTAFARRVLDATGLGELVIDPPLTPADLIRRQWRD
jgi:anti-anti-sigma factor